MSKLVIQAVVLFAVISLSQQAAAQTCGGSTVVVASYLQSYQKAAKNSVAYAWTGAHFSGGNWGHRTNQNNTITYTTDGVTQAISGPFTSSYNEAHVAQGYDTSTAEARAKCTNSNCDGVELYTQACITSKVDSAAAGAYARAGIAVPPQVAARKTGIGTLYIPNRMTLYSNVGDETGVWGLVVGIERGKAALRGEPLHDKKMGTFTSLDIEPFLAELLGINEKSLNAMAAKQREIQLAVGLEFKPHTDEVTVIEPTHFGFKPLDTDGQKSIMAMITSLVKKFRIEPCKEEKTRENCRVAFYEAPAGEKMPIEIPDRLTDDEAYSVYVSVLQGGREELETNGGLHPQK
jgi:hypothetical protein